MHDHITTIIVKNPIVPFVLGHHVGFFVQTTLVGNNFPTFGVFHHHVVEHVLDIEYDRLLAAMEIHERAENTVRKADVTMSGILNSSAVSKADRSNPNGA